MVPSYHHALLMLPKSVIIMNIVILYIVADMYRITIFIIVITIFIVTVIY